MLLEALLHTFCGKYFYFGFKINETENSSTALKDVLNLTSIESLCHSQFDSNFDNCHTLAYQILPNRSAKQVTVTDHMRQAVYLFRFGNSSLLCKKDASSFYGSCDSQNASKSSFITSYINNSKQQSVMFSFEGSGHANRSSSRGCFTHSVRKDRHLNRKNKKTIESHNALTCSSQYENKKFLTKGNCTADKNGCNQDYSKNIPGGDESKEMTDIFTSNIAMQFELSSMDKEQDISNTSSRIDWALWEREIKRKGTASSQCIMSSNMQYKYSVYSKENNAMQVSGPVKEYPNNFDMLDSLYMGTSPRQKENFNKETVTDSFHGHGSYDTSELDTFSEGKEKQTNQMQNKDELRYKQDLNDSFISKDSQVVSQDTNIESYTVELGTFEHGLSVNEAAAKNELKTCKENNETDKEIRTFDVVMPDSEGLETFFETQFTDEIVGQPKQDNCYKGLGKSNKQIPNTLLQTNMLGAPVNDFKDVSDGTYLNLPESEDLEAFLSTFDDGITDSGLYSDNTGTSVDNKGPFKSLETTARSTSSKNLSDRVLPSESYTHGKEATINHQSSHSISKDSKQSIITESFKSDKTQQHMSELESANVLYDTDDNELDCFLDNGTARPINENKNPDNSKNIMCENSNYLAHKIVTVNRLQTFDKLSTFEEVSPTEIFISECGEDHEIRAGKLMGKEQFSNNKINSILTDSVDLDEYLKKINISDQSIQYCENKIGELKSIALTPAIQLTADYNSDNEAVKKKLFEETPETAIKRVREQNSKNESGLLFENCSHMNTRQVCQGEATDSEFQAAQNAQVNVVQEQTHFDKCKDTAGGKRLHAPLIEDSNSFSSDNSFWDEFCGATENNHGELDCSMMRWQESIIGLEDKAHSKNPSENGNGSCSTGISNHRIQLNKQTNCRTVAVSVNREYELQSLIANQGTELGNTSVDLFEDAFTSQSTGKPSALFSRSPFVLVEDSDVEERKNTDSGSDGSIILDSPISMTGENLFKGKHPSLISINKTVEEKAKNLVKNVKFDRRLRRVSSCQLMDIKMKLNGSPLKGEKMKKKSCLKTKENLPECSLTKSIALLDKGTTVSVKQIKLDVVEEQSNLSAADSNEQIDNTLPESVSGSQDLFMDEEIPSSLNVCSTEKDNIQHAVSERCLMNSGHKCKSWANTFSSNFKQQVDISEDICYSQDLFTPKSQFRHSYPKRSIHIGQNENTSDGGKPPFCSVFSNNENLQSRAINACQYSEDKESIDRRGMTINIRSKDQRDDCQVKTHMGRENVATRKTSKQNQLKHTLMNITNFTDLYDQSSNADFKIDEVFSTDIQFTVPDTPVVKASHNIQVLRNFKGQNTNRQTSSTKEHVKKMIGSNVNCRKGVSTLENNGENMHLHNSNILLEVSPDLFADSPHCNRNNICDQSNSNSKLNIHFLCKKLF